MTPPVLTRFFSFADMKPQQGWELLKWCRLHGANEFTIIALVASTESDRMKAFFAKLESHKLSIAERRVLSGEPVMSKVQLWRLSDATERVLHEALPHGFVSREFDEKLWLEDLTIYRRGDFMMGVLSDEGGGVIRVTEPELLELRAAGLPERERLKYVNF